MAKQNPRGTEPERFEPDDDAFDDRDEFDYDELDRDDLDGELNETSEFGADDDYRIVDLHDPDELEDEEDGRARPSVDFATLLDQLLHDASRTTLRDLYVLSDLSRADADILRQQWSAIPVERRRSVLAQLIAAAADDLDLQLGRLLRIALHDGDARVRQAAVEGLWDDEEADLIGPLVQLLRSDPIEGVRAAAATALGATVLAGELDELDSALAMRAEEALLAVLHNEAEPVAVRRRALESIAYSGEAGVRQLIEDAYYSPDEEMHVSALLAMGRSADVRWRSVVRSELQNPSAAARAEAAYAAGELEAKDALRDLLRLLDDDVQSVRLAAIFALGRLGGREAREALEIISASDYEVEADTAEHALEEMTFYADPASAPLFDESEEDDEWWERRDEE